jgi:anti-anti-sigma regulatory factor
MTTTIAESGSNVRSRVGNATRDYGGAQIRAHCHHLATVVTIRGEISLDNVDCVIDATRRFVLLGNPLVLDLSNVKPVGTVGISLLNIIAEDCRAARVDWTLVAGGAVIDLLRDCDVEPAFPITWSVREALKNFAEAIVKRRQLMLPLIGKTA